MEKKHAIILIGAILLLILGGSIKYLGVFCNNIHVGDSEFQLPFGFYETESESSDITFTNGKILLGIREYQDNNITQHINEYENERLKQNFTLTITNFTIYDYEINKTVINNASYSIHYWFIHNNKVYEIYTLNGDWTTDSIIIKIIEKL